mmetsp:Transcript_788/g.2283  ORF Transcript_788/g.2283 Transcript_788/m.2283 type:complete len:212 (+) Transcript_788:919-1554(+)
MLKFLKKARSTAPVTTQTASSLEVLLKDTERNPWLLYSRSLESLGVWSDAASRSVLTKPFMFFTLQLLIRSDVQFEISELEEVVTANSASHPHECTLISSFFLRTKARLSLNNLKRTDRREENPEYIEFKRAVFVIVKLMLKAAHCTDTKICNSAVHEVVSFLLLCEKRSGSRFFEMAKEITIYCLDLAHSGRTRGKNRSPCGTVILRYAI